MQEPYAIIFDCDGTLADTMPPHYEAWVATIAPLGVSFSEDRFYAMGGWPTQQVSEWVVQEYGLDADPTQMTHDKEACFEQMLHRVLPVEPVLAVARRERGQRPLAVATGGMRRICEGILTHLGCLDWFDAIVCCEDVPRHKPNPDIFLEAARRLGVPPSQCLVYEDTKPGIESATRAGMKCIDVRTLFTPRRVS